MFIMQRYEISYKEMPKLLDISVKTVENQIERIAIFTNYMQSHLPTSMLMIGYY